MDTLLQDLRYAVRTLTKSRGFALAAVLTLALGIGASTALFSAVDALLLRPLPVHEPERLVEVSAVRSFGGGALSYPQYEVLGERSRALAGLTAATAEQLSLADGDYAEEVAGAFVAGNYFQLLGIRPALGRFFTAEDDQPGSTTAGVVLSYRLWERRFEADPGVIGRRVLLNGQPVLVAAVAPEEFTGTAVNRLPALWAPLALHEQVVRNSRIYSPMAFQLHAIGRLQPGTSREQAAQELSGIVQQVQADAPAPVQVSGIELRQLSRIPEQYEGSLLRFVALLGIATTLVLLIASVNVAGMLLVRASARRQEIAIRLALGAGRGRLVRQLVTEGMLLFLLGGAAGVLLAVWLTELLLAFRWPMPVVLDLSLHYRVLGFALLLSLLTGIGFGLIPALRASRPDLVPALKDAGRSGRGGRGHLRSAFVVGQVAMSLLLLVGAGLFLRALHQALSIDPGFNPHGVLVASVDLHRQRYEEAHGHVLYEQLLERVRQIPGVQSASLSVGVPLGPGGEVLLVEAAGADPAAGEGSLIRTNIVDPAYFHTLEIPLLRGRSFTEADREGAPRVAIVNEATAQQLWPGEDPIGQRFREQFSAFALMMGQDPAQAKEYEVVGVVPGGKYQSLQEAPEPFLFLPLAQNYRSRMVLALRPQAGATQVAAAVRSEVHALDPALPLLDLTPLPYLIADALLPQRIGAVLTTLFGVLGLLLAGVGIYGVMAYAVGQRTREIGLRMALGARAPDVVRLVLGSGFRLALLGVGLGLIAALAATRFIASLLYGVSATDPLAFAAVTLLLTTVALLASYIPARRAARVDPMIALRSE